MQTKKRAVWFLCAFLSVFALVYMGENVHRREFDHAFFVWYRNRTPENEAALHVQQRKNQMIKLQDSVIVASIVTGLYGAFIFAARFLKPRTQD